MLSLLLLHMVQPDEPLVRTPAIYRCPATEGESEKLKELVEDSAFDSLCIDPKPGPQARQAAANKLKFVSPSSVDTTSNLKWRNATIAFARGQISPKEWLKRIKNLHETVHFLSSPATPTLRDATDKDSSRATFSEMLILSWPGKPCLTSTDTWRTKQLPEAGALQSWVLAMNDRLGPMLYYRSHEPAMVKGAPTVLRADSKPGLLIFRQKAGKGSLTMYFNNSTSPISLGYIDWQHMTMDRGVQAEDERDTRLAPAGSLIVDTTGD